MKNISILLLILCAFSCRTEEDAGPAEEPTFMRYFGSENNNDAALALQAGDGFTLLSTTEIALGASQAQYKMKLIRTDLFGNLVWEMSYPSFSEPHVDMKATSFVQMANSGYLIIGDRINTDGTTDIQLLFTDENGILVREKIISNQNNASLHGHAVIENDDGDFLVLGSISGNPLKDMFGAKLNGEDLEVIWEKEYGDGAGNNTVLNRLYTNSNDDNFWGTSWKDPSSNNHKPRVIAAPENSDAPDLGNSIGDPAANEIAVDLCRINTGWAITGYSVNTSGNEDTYMMKVSNSSDLQFQTLLQNFPEQNDRGESICPATDGGYVVLGTVTTVDNGDDMFIAKFDLGGNLAWTGPGHYLYGSSERQDAASVRPTADGSYLIFGTTYFDNVKMLMLLKVNKDGRL